MYEPHGRYTKTPPLFLSEEAFTMLRALYEMDEVDSDLSFRQEKARYDHHRDRGRPDWYAEWARRPHPEGSYPDERDSKRKAHNEYWAFRELHRAGLLNEAGYIGYRITPMGRTWYERAVQKTRYVAI